MFDATANPAPEREDVRILAGDVREVLDSLPSDSVQCVVSSPLYWMSIKPGQLHHLSAQRLDCRALIRMRADEIFQELLRFIGPSGALEQLRELAHRCQVAR